MSPGEWLAVVGAVLTANGITIMIMGIVEAATAKEQKPKAPGEREWLP